MAVTSYATYEFYSGTYLGTAIASAVFPRLALRASAVIDQITFERAAKVITDNTDADTIEAIQMATCAIAEELQTQEVNGNVDNVTSERVGNYSVSYGAKAIAAMTNEEKQEKAGRVYLGQTGLMYPGIRRSDYEN